MANNGNSSFLIRVMTGKGAAAEAEGEDAKCSGVSIVTCAQLTLWFRGSAVNHVLRPVDLLTLVISEEEEPIWSGHVPSSPTFDSHNGLKTMLGENVRQNSCWLLVVQPRAL